MHCNLYTPYALYQMSSVAQLCCAVLCCQVPGLLVTDHFFQVPLDHSGVTPGDITLFVREVVAPVNARRAQPYLLYLQGGRRAWVSHKCTLV